MPNFLAYLGPAISKTGADISDFGDKQDALRRAMALMVQQRMDKLKEENHQKELLTLQQNQDKREQAKADRDATAEKDQAAFQKTLAAGKPAPAPDGTEIDPSAPDSERPGNVPLSRDEVIRKALEAGTLSPDKYIEYTKAKEITPTADIQDYMAAKGQGFGGSFMEFLKAKKQAMTIIQPGQTSRSETSAETRLAGQNERATKDYDQTKRAALAFQADYDLYKKQRSGLKDKDGIRVAQQGMFDKFISASTGKSTGEAQFNNAKEAQGLDNTLENLYDKYKHGSMSADATIQAMHDVTMSTAMKVWGKTKQANENTARQTARENKARGFHIDPLSLIGHDNQMLSEDSAAFSPSTPVVVKTKAQRDSLPPGTLYVGPDGHTATR